MATSVINPNQIEAKSTKYMQNNEYSSSPSQSEGIIQEMEPNCSESNANGKRGMTRSDTIETLLVDDGSIPLESGPAELSPSSAKSSSSDSNKKQTTSNEINTAIQLNKKNIISEFNRDIKWTVATERGYEKGPNKTRKPIHNFMEDFHFPTIDNKNAAVHLHPVSGLPVYIWLLADGHGGHEAPQFFIKEMRTAM